jgi:hypothetical protein
MQTLMCISPYGMKLAVTLLVAFIVTMQLIPETESQPVHPLKSDSSAGVGVSVTTVPLLKSPEQVDPQLIPAGFDVTVPPKSPVLLTLNVYFTVNGLLLVPVKPEAVTLIGPLVAPAGTTVRIELSETTVKVAAFPLNLTAVAAVKFKPLMTTVVPTRPLVGEKLVMVGATVNDGPLNDAPAGVTTLMSPVVAPAGTEV